MNSKAFIKKRHIVIDAYIFSSMDKAVTRLLSHFQHFIMSLICSEIVNGL